MEKAKSGVGFPRRLLLVEIERRCSDPACNARVFLGLTKEEARNFRGFECERCERWTDDVLTERDIPEWWEELAITSLDARAHSANVKEEYQPNEVTERLSAAYRQRFANDAGKDRGTNGDESL